MWRTGICESGTFAVEYFATTLITGVFYPMAVTGIAKVAFPEAANGSLIFKDGKAVGSRLIEQNFTDPKYFWGRPSATSPQHPTTPRLPAAPIWGRSTQR